MLRLDFSTGAQLGPGKIRLLEEVDRTGSISAAGRALGMSYRRAWTLVDAINHSFRDPAVLAQPGGARGGGAALTPWGRELVRLYRGLERDAAAAGADSLARLEQALSDPASGAPAPSVPDALPVSAR
ncbi:winged helix-turn-helix domain-containing protein [Oleisolibacter albus]|uniref:winged helix-turn-helix domain-containing protein n=1 Tax=Oleisolibacter albus TaxID=2171757 RepID=UPI001EFED323|nr:LysR family transcriptional regulator [Oleisolibacter albus]